MTDYFGSHFEPTRVLELALDDPIPAIDATVGGATYRRALVLIRLHDEPLGLAELELPAQGLEPERVAQQVWRLVAKEARAHLVADGLPAPDVLPAEGLRVNSEAPCRIERASVLDAAAPASVIVATHERPQQLKRCLDSLMKQEYVPAEIIVVDSGPRSEGTRELVSGSYGEKVKYIRVDSPGLALAHNAALSSATAPIVAFIDDDVVADPLWLSFLVAGFSVEENVGCTTGLILPLELETRAQWWVVAHSRLNKGFTRRVFDLDENRPAETLYPYTAGLFGSGTNMAFSARFLRENEGFDVSLGVGTPTRGGDDLAAFFDVLVRGYRLVYEPRALVWHDYRRDPSALPRHFFSYGMGLSAYLTRTAVRHPRRIAQLARLLPQGVAHMGRIRSDQTLGGVPRGFVRREWLGMVVGPAAYAASRTRARGRRCAARSAAPAGNE